MKIATFKDGTTKTTRSQSATHAWRITRWFDGAVVKLSQSKSYENAVKSSRMAIDDIYLGDDLHIDYVVSRNWNGRQTIKQIRDAKEENARRRALREKLVTIEIAEYQ